MESGVTKQPHKDRAHAVLGPSSSKRWFNCVGSVALSDGIDTGSSVFADEGTAAHELAQHCLATGFDADRFAGWWVNIEGHSPNEIIRQMEPREGENVDKIFEIDDEMVSGVQTYLDVCRNFINVAEPWEVLFEERVYISEDPVINGTCDFAAYNPATGRLVVVDLKYGRHISVDPTENTQAILYAIGTLKRLNNRGVKSIAITIVQPRDGGPPVKTWEPDVLELHEWEADLVAAGRVAEALVVDRSMQIPLDPKHFKVGDWCKFCPALGFCETKRRHMFEMADAQFEVIDGGEPSVTFPAPSELSDDKLSTILSHLEDFEAWKKSVIAYAHTQCEQGRQIPGWKLVQKRAYRKWKDEEEAIELLELRGIDPYQPRKVRTPADVEKFMPGKNPAERKAFLQKFVEAKSSGTVLAPESDKRPAVKASADEQFEEVSDGQSA